MTNLPSRSPIPAAAGKTITSAVVYGEVPDIHGVLFVFGDGTGLAVNFVVTPACSRMFLTIVGTTASQGCLSNRRRRSRLLQALAHQSGQLTNFTQIGGQIGIDDKITRKYIGILEQLFLVHCVSPWFRNELKRLIKTPKPHFVDSGLLASLLALTAEQIAKNHSTFGAVLETFVFSEVHGPMKAIRSITIEIRIRMRSTSS